MKKRIVFLLLFTVTVIIWLTGCQNKKTADDQTELTEMPEFALMDLQGNKVTNDIFKDHECTLINVWATSCGPCLDELPVLQSISTRQEFAGIGVIGIVADGKDAAPQANELLQELDIDFTNLLPDEAFLQDFIMKQDAVPYSLLVDQNGKILKLVMGTQTDQEFADMIANIK